MTKKTLIVGASTNPERYAFKAIHLLLSFGYSVVLFGNKSGEVSGHKIAVQWTDLDLVDIHTVTLYVGPHNQVDLMQKITDIKPKRVIFNPGTENPAFYSMLESQGIFYEEACTLVLLNLKAY